MAEVIDLSDDEVCEISVVQSRPTKISQQKSFKCLNPDCRSLSDLVKASDNIRRFYGVEAYYKKKRVCKKCLNNAQIERNTIVNMLKSGTNLLAKEVRLSQKTIIVSESDSDKTDDETSSEESEYEFDLVKIGGYKVANGNLDSDSQMEVVRGVIMDIISEIDLDKQMLDGSNIIQARLKQAEKDFDELNAEFNLIEKKIGKVRNNFYNSFKTDTRFLPPLEIGPPELFTQSHDATAEVIAESLITNVGLCLPPVRPLVRSPVKVDDEVYMMKHTKLSKWIPAKVSGIETTATTTTTDPKKLFYKVQYKKEDNGEVCQKIVDAKNLAYFYECPTRIPVGTRVIATFCENYSKFFYVGIIAESPTGANKYRYLIFFDDGYAQYALHSDIRVVVYCSSQVWEDVITESKDFIKDYVQTYPERPMVRLQKYNYIKTELENNWWKAQVLEVDSSLVKMYFPAVHKTEWIYRGSTRLSPLFDKKVSMKLKSEHPNKIIRRRTIPINRSGPVVEYINFDGERESQNIATSGQPTEKRAVAKKSSASKGNICSLPIKEQLVLESSGCFTSFKINSTFTKFHPHQCSSKCINETSDVIESKMKSPLTKPILLGWKRQVCVQKKKKKGLKSVCNFTAPCGRRLRSLEEILMYLRLTKSKLQIDDFTVDPEISLPREWEPSIKRIYIEDITDGKEDVLISCVNSVEKDWPKKLIYSSVRIPSEQVTLNLDPRYLVCCSCEDDCKDKSQCECCQLTTEAANFLSENKTSDLDVGYKYRRLEKQVCTGIFECNSMCSCKSSCLNRVVQFPIRQKLQLFKTAKRGWGVRTLHDIPKGVFICVYVGKVLTEAEANEGGMIDGADDYYANLDFIEVVESMKEGYEREVEDIELTNKIADKTKGTSMNCNIDIETIDLDNHDSTVSGRKRKTKCKEDSAFKCTLTQKVHFETRGKSGWLLAKTPCILNGNESEDSNDMNRQPQTFEPTENMRDLLFSKLCKKSMREYYSVDESIYVMDAKVTGNIGRYLNHSCDPNMFVQNVFVDTHDPRFPWISFFAGINIKAGMELTWDYNYEVGSVPDKVKYCYCRSSNCRGRLL